ncbi:hypothetical protein DFH28DRAFT_983859 [Melampsora americana]|nr:hypothetical protein DFH28DRAFT_983859 [Melampsora americana]
MRVTDCTPMKICSLAFVLLVMSATPSKSLPSGGVDSHTPVPNSGNLFGIPIDEKRLRRRSGIQIPRIYPIPLIWGVDWDLLWYFVDPDKLTQEGLDPKSFKNIDNKHVATIRQTALQAATRAIEVYDLLHPSENLKALSEIRRLAILESEPNLMFRNNPTLKESTAAIFLADVPKRTKAQFQQISHDMNGAQVDQDQDGTDDDDNHDNDGDEDQEKDPKGDKEPAKDWAHVQLWDSNPVEEI